MARLTDMLDSVIDTTKTTETTKPSQSETDHLVEALEVLIEMAKENALTEEEISVLDETIDLITESVDVEELTEKKMSAKAKMAARQYRLKNKARLALISKKKKACMVKIAGKTDKLACGSDGRPHRIDKARSKAARMGAKSR